MTAAKHASSSRSLTMFSTGTTGQHRASHGFSTPVSSTPSNRRFADKQASLIQAARFAPDNEKRQCRRRGLRCNMQLIKSYFSKDTRPTAIPAECFNVSKLGLYGIVSVGHGVAMGQRYTFQLTIGEPGPAAAEQIVTQQGTIVRTELLISPDGRNDRVGIGVKLVGQRDGVIPMPDQAM